MRARRSRSSGATAFIWVVRFLLPKALKDRDPLALTSSVLAALIALFAFLLTGVGARSADL